MAFMHWLFANDEVLRADLPGVCLIGIYRIVLDAIYIIVYYHFLHSSLNLLMNPNW